MKKEYNWWTDPKNAEEVKRLSWWDHVDNKEDFKFPISVVKDPDGNDWIACTNKETEKLIPIHGLGQGKTKDDAISNMFTSMRAHLDFLEDRMRSYQRLVPFRKGDWSRTGGTWFVIFGLNFYFRYGEGMKGGKYIPFTKLNISFHNEWKQYNRWLNERS